MMRAYPVLCGQTGCQRQAVYKIASRWSDGVTQELKTYGLSCEECLPAEYQRSREKQAVCRRARGESLEIPGIYRLEATHRDRELERLTDLEQKLSANPPRPLPL